MQARRRSNIVGAPLLRSVRKALQLRGFRHYLAERRKNGYVRDWPRHPVRVKGPADWDKQSAGRKSCRVGRQPTITRALINSPDLNCNPPIDKIGVYCICGVMHSEPDREMARPRKCGRSETGPAISQSKAQGWECDESANAGLVERQDARRRRPDGRTSLAGRHASAPCRLRYARAGSVEQAIPRETAMQGRSMRPAGSSLSGSLRLHHRAMTQSRKRIG